MKNPSKRNGRGRPKTNNETTFSEKSTKKRKSSSENQKPEQKNTKTKSIMEQINKKQSVKVVLKKQ